MSVYGDLSKAQRDLLQQLFHGASSLDPAEKSRLGRSQAKRAVSIDTAHYVDRKSRQTAANLRDKGFVQFDDAHRWQPRVWLTEAGLDLMRSLDYRHARTRS